MAEAGNYGQVGLPNAGCGDDVNGIERGGAVRPLPPQYHYPVYCNSSDNGAMSGGRATSRSAGETTVVGSGRNQLRRRGQEVSIADWGVG